MLDDVLTRRLAGAADRGDVAAVDAMFAPVRDGLDVFVSNAAASTPAPIAELTTEVFDRVMTVNAKVPLLAAMRRAATLLRDHGRIIAVSSLNTALPAPGTPGAGHRRRVHRPRPARAARRHRRRGGAPRRPGRAVGHRGYLR